MTLPNYLSLLRIFLVPVFFIFLTYYDVEHPYFRVWALSIFLLASLTDALDGFIARRFKMKTPLGTFLDPLADKLLLLTAFLGIQFAEAFTLKPPLWIVIIIVFRDIFILGGLVAVFMTTRYRSITPNLIGKTTTLFQMMTIISVLAELSISPYLWSCTAITTIISAISYLKRGIDLVSHGSKALS
jgi:cardiolipin synthase (CMP-forming)